MTLCLNAVAATAVMEPEAAARGQRSRDTSLLTLNAGHGNFGPRRVLV
jgi:hypothetical protein